MARVTNFTDFVDSGSPSNQPKPYIYVIKYIMGKDDYVDELKEYILNYQDDDSDYEDDDYYDSFMEKLKILAEENDIEEIEEIILDYEADSTEESDEDDDDYEEKSYNGFKIEDSDVFDSEKDVMLDYIETNEDFEDVDFHELEKEVEESNLSEKLKEFLIEDLVSDEEEFEDVDIIEEKFYEEEAEDVDYEEIIDEEKLIDEIEEENEGAFIRSDDIKIKTVKIEAPDGERKLRVDPDYVKPSHTKRNIVDLTTDETYEKAGEVMKEELRESYLDKLPAFVCTTNGKKPTKKQLEELIRLVKESERPDDTIKINGEYE